MESNTGLSWESQAVDGVGGSRICLPPATPVSPQPCVLGSFMGLSWRPVESQESGQARAREQRAAHMRSAVLLGWVWGKL